MTRVIYNGVDYQLLKQILNLSNIDIPLSELAHESTLESIDSILSKLQFNDNNYLKIDISEDDVGLAKDKTVLSNLPRYLKLNDGTGVYDEIYRSGNSMLISINEDKVGLAKDISVLGIKSQTDKLSFDANNFLKVSTQTEKIVSQNLSSTIINASSTYNTDITVPIGKSGVAITLKATYNASATGGVNLSVYFSPDGTNYDTDTDYTYTHPFSAGGTKQKTYIVPAVTPYIRIGIENLDTTYSVTVDLWTTFI